MQRMPQVVGGDRKTFKTSVINEQDPDRGQGDILNNEHHNNPSFVIVMHVAR